MNEQNVTDLLAEVAAEPNIKVAVFNTVNAIVSAVDAAKTNPAALQALCTNLSRAAGAFGHAVTEGTPAEMLQYPPPELPEHTEVQDAPPDAPEAGKGVE